MQVVLRFPRRTDRQQATSHRLIVACVVLTTLLTYNQPLAGKGLGGRGGGGGRANVGAVRPNAGAARPNVGAARPSIGNFPSGGASTLNTSGGKMPMQRPQTSLPHLGGNSGLSPSPVNRPSIGHTGFDRPSSSAPGVQRPNLSRPETRPAQPGQSRPNIGNSGLNRPETLPGRPNIERPNLANRPNVDRPSMPDFGRLPNGRPSGSDVGDFLGIQGPLGPNRPTTLPGNTGSDAFDRPVRPDRPTTLPGNTGSDAFDRPVRPDRPTTLPEEIGNRPNVRPDLSRPVDRPRPGEWPGLANRPDPDNRLPINRRPSIDIGDVNIGNNTVISNKPSWANIDNNQINTINQRWQNKIGNATTLPALSPNRHDHFHDWGNGVRDNWYDNRYSGCFRPEWWARHSFHCSGWHYFYAYSYYPHTYWWSTPTYANVTSWFTWTAPAVAWQQPAYYDYGTQGNVVYQDNSVYIGGDEIAGAAEFAKSAAILATVPEPETQQVAEQAEWLPLGTFALTTDPDDVKPTRIVQLAVNKQAIVSGTLYNSETDQTQAIQGRVDKDTQRVALRIGSSEDVIVETGLYNLTQDEASILVHFGSEVYDEYLLVRLPSPDQPGGSIENNL